MKTTLRFIDYILAITLLCSACQTDSGYKKAIYRIEKELHYIDSIPDFQFTSDGPIEIALPKEKVTFIPSEVIELDHYVPLETNDSCLFGNIQKLLIREDRIFVMDWANKVIMIFDQTGKFKAKIDHAGNGPGEYIRIKDFDVRNGLIYVYALNAKMLVYTLNGEWITTKDMAVVFSEFSICKDGSFFISTSLQRNEFIPEIDSYSFLLGYPDSIITHKGFKRSEAGNKMSILAFIDNVTRYGDTLIFIPQYSPSVYQLNPDKTLGERYRVLFEKPVTEEALEKANPEICNRDVVANGYQYLAFGWLETSEFAFFQYFFPGKDKDMPIQSTSCYYSKQSRKTIRCDYADYEDPAFLYYFLPLTTHQDLFVSVLPPNRIIENKSRIQEKNANNPEVLRILNQLKEEDNPVLMFFRIKENCPLF